jgi:spore coat protein U-like protein
LKRINFAASIVYNFPQILGWRLNVIGKRFAAALAAGACLVSANSAFAAIATTVLNVSANIPASCDVLAENNGQLNFGALNMRGMSSASTQVRVLCNAPDDVRPMMRLTSSNGQNGNFRLAGGSTPISYMVSIGGMNQAGNGVMSGQSFQMPNNGGSSIRDQYLTVKVEVDGEMMRDYAAGDYTDQILLEVSF